MIDTENDPETSLKNEKAIKKSEAKQTALLILKQAGMTPANIAKSLDYTPQHVSALTKNNLHFITRKRVKKAIKAIDYFCDIANYHEDNRIKPNDVLSAAEKIIERSHPRKADTNDIPHISFTQVNVNLGMGGTDTEKPNEIIEIQKVTEED